MQKPQMYIKMAFEELLICGVPRVISVFQTGHRQYSKAKTNIHYRWINFINVNVEHIKLLEYNIMFLLLQGVNNFSNKTERALSIKEN